MAYLDFPWQAAASQTHFRLKAAQDHALNPDGPQSLNLTLLHDRGWLSSDVVFTGRAMANMYDLMPEKAGLMQTVTIKMPIQAETSDEPLPQVNVEVTLTAQSLPTLDLPKFCAN